MIARLPRSPAAVTTVVAVLILASLLAGVVLPRRDRSQATTPVPAPPTVREVARKELTRRDGRLHLGTEAEPFTGHMVDRYPSGALRSRTAVTHGLVHGVSEGWYTNGVLQIHEEFREGVAHGTRIRWFVDGVKASETPIVDGKVRGLYRAWHTNGVLAAEIPMVDDQPDGLSRAFRPDGSLKASVRMVKGQKAAPEPGTGDAAREVAAAPSAG